LNAQAPEDLAGMKRGLRSSRVSVVAELDLRPKGAPSRRFILSPDGPLAGDAVESLGETNSGDPKTLTRFFRWAIRTATRSGRTPDSSSPRRRSSPPKAGRTPG